MFPRNLTLEEGRLKIFRLGYFASFTLTPYAKFQLAQFMGIAVARFHSATPAGQDRLFADAMKRLAFPEHRMITLRGRCREIRAVVDELCMPFSHQMLVRSLWNRRRQFQVQWFSYQECSMHLRLINPQTICQIRSDDYLIAGVHIASSDVGFRPLTVEPVVFRLNSCGGLIGFGTRSSTLSLEPTWSSGCIEDLVSSSVDLALSQASDSMRCMEAAMGHRLPDPDDLRSQSHLGRVVPGGFLTRSLVALEREDHRVRWTLYGLMHAMTVVAQELAPDTRLKLESLAGRDVPSALK